MIKGRKNRGSGRESEKENKDRPDSSIRPENSHWRRLIQDTATFLKVVTIFWTTELRRGNQVNYYGASKTYSCSRCMYVCTGTKDVQQKVGYERCISLFSSPSMRWDCRYQYEKERSLKVGLFGHKNWTSYRFDDRRPVDAYYLLSDMKRAVYYLASLDRGETGTKCT